MTAAKFPKFINALSANAGLRDLVGYSVLLIPALADEAKITTAEAKKLMDALRTVAANTKVGCEACD